MALAVVVLAAGEGTRMKSRRHKVLHEAAGRPLLEHILRAVHPLEPERTVVVVGFSGEQVRERFAGAGLTFVEQGPGAYGTGHALRESARGLTGFAGKVLVLNGDGPLLRSETLARLVAALPERGMAMLTCRFSDPTGLGRIKRGEGGNLVAIVEEKDASPEEKAITEVNPGVYLFDESAFEKAATLTSDNAAGEYYITDMPRRYLAAGEPVRTLLVEDETELLGVNDRRQLADAERILRERVRARWLAAGVTMLHPESTFLDDTVTLARDVVLEPGVILKGETTVGEGARIGAHSVLEHAVIAAGEEVAPHTLKREGATQGRGAGEKSL